MGIDEPGDADGKTGKELFLQLLRRLPSAQAEDYYQNGKWNDEDIKLDFDLLEAHRKEAGAEDPPALEELEIPELPDNKPAGAAWGTPGYQRPAAFGGVGPGVAAAKPAVPKPGGLVARAVPVVSTGTQRITPAVSGLRPQQPKSAPPTGLVSAAGGPSAELRQIALFIAKWKLEATKTKLLLARLTPPRRRWVMSNFSQSGGGLAATAQLEQFIARCERDNSWASADSSSPAGASRPLTGIKRPLTSAISTDPNKRLRVGTPVAGPARTGATAYASAIRPAATAYGARTSPAWLAGSSAGSVNRFAPAAARPPFMPAQRTMYGGGAAYGAAATRPGFGMRPQMMQQRPGIPKAAPKYGGGTIKPAAPKAKGGGGKPGSLIANLLRM